MEPIWDELYRAALAALKPRQVSRFIEAGGVAAAIESASGKIYTGVCVDSACTLGVCAGAAVSAIEASRSASSADSAGAGVLAGAGLRRGGIGIGPFRLA